MSAAGATAAARHVRIVDRKATAHRTVLKIDDGAVQVQRHFLGRHDRHAVLRIFCVDGRVEFLFEAQAILQAGATTAGDTDAKHRAVLDLFRFHVPFDFAGRRFRKYNCHDSTTPPERSCFANRPFNLSYTEGQREASGQTCKGLAEQNYEQMIRSGDCQNEPCFMPCMGTNETFFPTGNMRQFNPRTA